MQNKTSIITGKITFLSKPTASGWHHGKIKDEDGVSWAISGNALAGLKDGSIYEFKGKEESFRGEPQIKVESAIPSLKANNAAVTRYLMENFNGLGQKTVKDLIALWETSGMTIEELRQTIVYEPYKLESWAEGAGLGRKIKLKMGKTKGHPDVEHVYRALVLQHRVDENNKVLVSDATLRKVAKFLLGIPPEATPEEEQPKKSVGQALDDFKDDPFMPIFAVDGYGFLSADAVWKGMDKPLNHENRVGALGWHVLETSCESEGHTFLPKEQYGRAIANYDRNVTVKEVFDAMSLKNIPVIEEDGGYYIKRLWAAENAVAERLQDWLKPGSAIVEKSVQELNEEIKNIEIKAGFSLDEEQRSALVGVATSKVKLHTVTAMPGCGKTAIMEFLAQIVKKDGGKVIAFMAPTGKASKVLDKRVKKVSKDLEAITVHSAIGYGSEDAENATLSADVIVVDEFSMVDLPLMRMLLKSMKPTAHLVCVGDQDQLPSVGPGSILRDILELPFDHHQLHQVHRNSGNILKLVKSIKGGVYKRFDAIEGAENDVLVYGLPGIEKIPNVIDKYIEEVNKRVDGLKKVCLLTGLRKGDPRTPGWNITYLNKALQDRMNPEGGAISGSFIKINDRIIIRKNQRHECVSVRGEKTTERLANGDTGSLLEVIYGVDRSKIESVKIEFDDGRILSLPSEVLSKMDLAYALTIHSYQGSEFECAMVVMTNGHASLFNRNLLYTAVSRAKEKLYLFGDGAVLTQIVSRNDNKRNSKLVAKSLSVGVELDIKTALPVSQVDLFEAPKLPLEPLSVGLKKKLKR